jgi:hypothetical protein
MATRLGGKSSNATESCDRRGQKPAGDDLRLIVQNAEMAPSVAKIDPDSHLPYRLLFCKVPQRRRSPVSLHSSLSCSPHFECRLRQLTASEAHRPSHPILTEQAGGSGAGFSQERQRMRRLANAERNCSHTENAVQSDKLVAKRSARFLTNSKGW